MTTKPKFSIAVVQNLPLRSTEASISHALAMVDEAAATDANLIVLPEMFSTPYEFALMQAAAGFSSHALAELRNIARKRSVIICAGSLPVKSGNLLFNRSYLIDESGNILYEYDKCHLFDVRLKNIAVSESKFFEYGRELKVAPTALGAIGTLICYDIRFPEAARALTMRGMQILCVPAAFSVTTGDAHWHTVMRARAIENQVFVCAASPARDPQSSYPAYGHSMIITPWGDVLAEAKTNEEIIMANVDIHKLEEVRRQLPLLQHRRPELY